MKKTLHILSGNVSVGSLVYDRAKDEISLSYEEAWQFGAESFPMSLSLPLARKKHSDASIRPFLQGLLPDSPAVIEAWGKRFQVSPRNPFDVIKHVGEDCAGALQFVRPEPGRHLPGAGLLSKPEIPSRRRSVRRTNRQANEAADEAVWHLAMDHPDEALLPEFPG